MAEALKVQLGIRQNAEELQDFLKDLNSWEEAVKTKDEELRMSKIINKQKLPPIRNQAKRKKKKKKKKKAKEDSSTESKDGSHKQATRISSYDYRSWDQYNVDRALEEMDLKEEMKTLSSTEEESEDTDEDIEHERRLQRALLEKDKGNLLFKEGKYDEAINCYTSGIQLDPANAILPANRAMCLLKLQRYGAAEADCSHALRLDGSYTKAYLRRAAARSHLGKHQEAEADYREALRLEPSNRQAKEELQNVGKVLGKNRAVKSEEKKTVEDCSSKVARSEKHLRRVVIEEIGTESESDNEETTRVSTRALATPSSLTEERINTVKQAALVDDSFNNDSNVNHQPDQQGGDLGGVQPPLPSTAQCMTSSVGSPGWAPAVAAPKTSAQFHSDWRTLQKQPERLFQYFRKINPESYQRLFQQSIESDLLVKITQILHDYYILNALSVYKELKHLSEVKRFNVTVMFLADSEKKAIQELFSYMRRNQVKWNLTGADINDLAKKYKVL